MRFFLWRLWALFAPVHFARKFEGPAKLEVFGHQSHIGWLRSSETSIEMLSVEGKVLFFDARSAFRLTPITMGKLADYCLFAQQQRENAAKSARRLEDDFRDELRNKDKRISHLRASLMALGLNLATSGDLRASDVHQALEEDNALQGDDDDDLIPF